MTPPPAPVFVDATGRRRRLTRGVGAICATLLTGYLAVVGVGLFTGTDLPLTPWPGNGGANNGVGAEPGHQRTRAEPPSPDARSRGASPLAPAASTTPPSTTAPRTAVPGAEPTATVTAPGRSESRATPRAVGRTKSANPHKPE